MRAVCWSPALGRCSVAREPDPRGIRCIGASGVPTRPEAWAVIIFHSACALSQCNVFPSHFGLRLLISYGSWMKLGSAQGLLHRCMRESCPVRVGVLFALGRASIVIRIWSPSVTLFPTLEVVAPLHTRGCEITATTKVPQLSMDSSMLAKFAVENRVTLGSVTFMAHLAIHPSTISSWLHLTTPRGDQTNSLPWMSGWFGASRT